MNNSIYGKKKQENLRKRVKVRLVNNAKSYKKWVSRSSFVSQKISRRNFVAIHEIKPVLMLRNRSMQDLTSQILDLSKLLMYEFHYNYIGVTYGCGAKLLLKDTDSLVYRTESDDL